MEDRVKCFPVEPNEACTECMGSSSCELMTPCIRGRGECNHIMIIGDTPTFFEDSEDEIFTGHRSKMLSRELYNVGIDMGRCYLTKAVKCYHGEGKVTKDTIRRCRSILYQEIEEIKPQYILTLGALSYEVLFGKGSITKNRGKLQTFGSAQVISTYNPGAITHQPSLKLEFDSDLAYFARVVDGWKAPDNFKFKIVDSISIYKELQEAVANTKVLTYDIESTGLDEYAKDAHIVMCGIYTDRGGYIVPLKYNDYVSNKDVAFFTHFLTETLKQDTPYEKIAHNAKFDNRWLRKAGVTPYVTYDTFLASYLLNVNIPHGLKYLAKTYLGAVDYDEGIEFKYPLTSEEFKRMAKYCALDVYYTYHLYFLTLEALKKDGRLYDVLKYIVMPGERVLQKIESNGLYVNQAELDRVLEDYRNKRDILDVHLETLLPPEYKGGTMNFNSPKQLAELLFTKLKLPIISKTSGGAPSTGKATLLRLVDRHEIPRLILERRKYDKAINGFLEPWKIYLKRDGRLHSTYNIAQTATGRLSAQDPNPQQIPRDKNVRGLVGAPEGRVFIEADYSQIELRVGAFVSGADSMKNAYRRGEDIHRKTASRVSHVSMEEVTKEMRTSAKAVNFGFLYGMGWKTFKAYAFDSYGVVVNDTEAQNARISYFDLYPELIAWHERQRREVNRAKCVRTFTGRIRHLPDVDSPDSELRGRAERQAINTPVQSFASDITLLAMILIDKNIERRYKDRAMLIGQVHDAIMVECDEDIGREVALMVKKCMESVPVVLAKYFKVNLDIPIIAEVEMGKSWSSCEPVE